MQRLFLFSIAVCCTLLQAHQALGQPRNTEDRTSVSALRQEIRALRERLKTQREEFQRRLRKMEARIDGLSATETRPSEQPPGRSEKKETVQTDLDQALQQLTSEPDRTDTRAPSAGGAGSAVQRMNPDISVIVDTFYHQDNAENNIQDVLTGIPGVGHAHGHGHGHDHGHLEEGFNMRHLELHLSADVDPYFRAWAIAAISEHGAEMEEAVIETTSLPYGLQLKGGKFFSDFGRINTLSPEMPCERLVSADSRQRIRKARAVTDCDNNQRSRVHCCVDCRRKSRGQQHCERTP